CREKHAAMPMLHLVHIPALVEHLPGSPQQKIANFHTLLNIAIALLFIPFLSWIAKIFRKLLPQQELESSFQVNLNKELLAVPEEALISSKKEIYQLAKMVKKDMINQLKGYIDGTVSKEDLDNVENIIDD